MQNKSDAQLLGEYAAQHSDPAFAEIVARHTDLVYSAALRQTGSPELAREIAQSVFTDLARKARALAGDLRPDTSLAGWLFRGTRFAGLKLLRDDRRRQTRERQFMEHFNPAAETAPDWERVAPVLDEAMAELGDADHEAVLLRYFKNQDFQAVGRALGVSDVAAQRRVSRAVERLREFFAQRGVKAGASGLVVLISANSVQAAPSGLAATLTSASLAGAGAGTGTTVTLLKFVAWTKAKTAIAVGVGVLFTSGTATMIIQSTKEPSYHGHTVSHWLEQIGSSDAANSEAWDAMRHFRKAAVPYIVRALEGTPRQRLKAMMACQAVGRPAASGAMPTLVRVLDSGGPHAGQAARILVEIGGTDHLPALIRNLQNRNDDTRRGVLLALGELGAAASPAVPDLLLLLQEPGVDGAAAEALGRIRSTPESVVPALLATAETGDASLRRRSIEALGQFGSAAREALPTVRRALTDTEARVRAAATNALRQIDRETATKAGA